MKTSILLLFITLFATQVLSQERSFEDPIYGRDSQQKEKKETTNNFKIIDNDIVWQSIFETNLTFDELIMKLKESDLISGMEIFDNKIIGNLNNINADYKGAGYKSMTAPILLTRSFLTSLVVIDYKEKRYRVTLKRLKTIQKSTDPLTEKGEESYLSDYWIKKNKLRRSFHGAVSEILNYTFIQTFTFPENTEADNW